MSNPPVRALLALVLAALAIARTDYINQIVIGVSNVQSGPSRSLGQELTQGSMAYRWNYTASDSMRDQVNHLRSKGADAVIVFWRVWPL